MPRHEPRSRSATPCTLLLVLLILLALPACGPDPGMVGRVAVTPTGSVPAGSAVAWKLTYVLPADAGPDAQIRVMFPHPYYNNRPANRLPQLDNPSAPGYCRLTVADQEQPLTLAKTGLYPRHLVARPPAEGWRRGQTLIFDLGDDGQGGKNFRAPFAADEQFAPFVVVDLEGDGRFEKPPHDCPAAIIPRGAATADLFAPATLAVGETFEATLTFRDEYGNPTDSAPAVETILREPGDNLRGAVGFVTAPKNGFVRLTKLSFAAPGVYRLRVRLDDKLPEAVSQPIEVAGEPTDRLLFGDPHGHSIISDGARDPQAYYKTARGPAGLDFAALTDHEWQIDWPEWAEIQILCRHMAEPGFVTLLGWENSLGGHGIIYYPNCDATPPIGEGGTKDLWQVALGGGRPASWQRYEGRFRLDYGFKPALWDHLDLTGAIFVPHTTATSDMGDEADLDRPDHIPLVEVYSGHGSNFSAADPDRVPNFAPSGTILRLLNSGRRFGLIASSDSHDSRPGLATWGRTPGGLTGVWAADTTRAAIFAAFKNRRTYATTGHRSIVRFAADDEPMGARFATDRPVNLTWEVIGDGAVAGVEIWRNGEKWHEAAAAPGEEIFRGAIVDPAHYGPTWYLLLVRMVEGGRAWTSPIFVDDPRTLTIDAFTAEDAGGVDEVVLLTESGRETKSLTLLRRQGDDGGPGREGYTLAGRLDASMSRIHFRDDFAPAPGLTTYYLIEEETPRGRLRHGPIALTRFPEAEYNGGRYSFVIWRHGGPAQLEIKDVDGNILRRIELPPTDTGRQAFTWDGRDENGRAAGTLNFFRVVQGEQKTRWKPLVRPAEVAP
jgi:Protein of unknown function (DUF3604)/FlgD Ig-like domain